MKNLLMILLVTLVSGTTLAQSKKSMTAVIQTSAECGSCKERIEEKLNYTSGIKFAELDLITKKVEVKFNPSKISKDEIKKIISSLGYDADDVEKDPTAFEALPACCKPGGMDKK